MSIPITIEKLLNENIVESARIEFKENWNPDATLKTISAFANDIDNWGGGYIVIGLKENQGQIDLLNSGLNINEIDNIQKDILRYCNFLKPKYIPETEHVNYKGKNLLLVWCPGGYDRPYLCPKKPSVAHSERIYYIRKLSSTIEATPNEITELISLTRNIPFDDRINVKANISDLKLPLIKAFLEEIGSSLANDFEKKSPEELARNLRIADGPQEFFKPINVGLLFFNYEPDKFFPYCQIDLVNIPDPTGQGMEEFVFKGPIDQQLKDVLRYIKNNVIAEKVFKVQNQAEAIRIKNYSYEAIEEFVSNAIYHRSYQLYEPITIRIEKELIEITSAPGPDRSISDEDIKNLTMRSRRYRNRRIGDFLKELNLVEGRNTGIPTALKSIKNNGSPLPKFITDEERSFFSVIIPIHEAFKTNKAKATSSSKAKRKTKEEIKDEILDLLSASNFSAASLYHKLNYSGNPSRTFRDCINDLISEGQVKYVEENKNSSTNLLTKI